MQDTITPVDNVALSGDKNVFTLGQEHLFRFPGPVGKAKKLERDRRREMVKSYLVFSWSILMEKMLEWLVKHSDNVEWFIANIFDYIDLSMV